MIECESCGVLVKKKGKNTRYCGICSKEVELEKTRIRVEKYRNSINM